MISTISSGPTVVFLIASHTNFALFLLSNPHLKKNVEHIYIMGGGVRSKNPTGCYRQNVSFSSQPQQCGDIGNLFTDYTSNPYAEFNFFMDPFAAYQVLQKSIGIYVVANPITKQLSSFPYAVGNSFWHSSYSCPIGCHKHHSSN